ncbi:hypothetical protein EVAR_19058_1 [Eumeta japonica]|uniref:Uncharacterized protein n=1 Tax=Eumeta variegata TaxID=151549 RepID=A0A4C1UPS1_EUMVA|nr:hypothetical protein EVAR_19058_1 [Eumeta japonica]
MVGYTLNVKVFQAIARGLNSNSVPFDSKSAISRRGARRPRRPRRLTRAGVSRRDKLSSRSALTYGLMKESSGGPLPLDQLTCPPSTSSPSYIVLLPKRRAVRWRFLWGR